MSVAHLLYQLQTIDLEIDSVQSQLQHLQEQIGETAELQAARSALQQAQQALAKEQVRLRSLDLDVKTQNEHIKAQEARLYGGKITNPRELDGLAKDVQMLKHNRDKVEDALLAVMLAAIAALLFTPKGRRGILILGLIAAAIGGYKLMDEAMRDPEVFARVDAVTRESAAAEIGRAHV
jgi:hypothetical protein